MKRQVIIRKMVVGGLTVGVGIAHAHDIYPDSGTASQIGLSECSPHGAGGSNGGSVFYSCARQGCEYIEERGYECTDP